MTFIIIPNTGRPTQTDTLTPAHYAAADAGEIAIVRVSHGVTSTWIGCREHRTARTSYEFYDSGQWLDVPRCEMEGLKI